MRTAPLDERGQLAPLSVSGYRHLMVTKHRHEMLKFIAKSQGRDAKRSPAPLPW